jgi:hypothetical protein
LLSILFLVKLHFGPRLLQLTHYRLQFKKHRHLGIQGTGGEYNLYIGQLSVVMLIFGPTVIALLKPKCLKAKIVVIKFISSQTCLALFGPRPLQLTYYRLEFKKHRHLGMQGTGKYIL